MSALITSLFSVVKRKYNKWRFAGDRYTDKQKTDVRLKAKGRL